MLVNGIHQVHFEPTTKCNAKCPMCSRTNNDVILQTPVEVTISQFIKYFPESLVKDLAKFKFCGNYGDPAAARHLLEQHQYLLSINPQLEITVSTNGGLRSPQFWSRLGQLYSNYKKCFVEFHIDGLEDTNHIYRIGVNWKKLIANVEAFNAAGGRSQWVFIPFFHNEHQIEQAEAMSSEIGCDRFVIKPTTRFKQTIVFYHKNGKLRPPTTTELRGSMPKVGIVDCVAERRKEIYVDAWGRLWPCCWTGSAAEKHKSWPMIVDPSINSIETRTITAILQDKQFNDWVQKMYGDQTSVCTRCSNPVV